MKRARKFQGEAKTLVDCCDAEYLVVVRCERCDVRRQMHPYSLLATRAQLASAALDTPLPGFFCKTCQSKVSVTITCTYSRPGG
ncbi:MAG TPA: hypothetical protein VGG10_13210 [Rhizomicrobium sp.]